MNDRARMPFALVGVILLVASTTLSATVVTHDPSSTPTVDRAMDGAKAETVTALRTAADDAATRTAANPVTIPANSTAGRALNDSQPFRDALRLRIYLLASERLENVQVRRGGVEANASLPPVPDTTVGYRTAIERVQVERAGHNGTALRVRIDDVRLAGVHQGRPVATEALSPTFVVSNPALFMHDRTKRFERRANATVVDPGLGRRLTTRLYPVAWARGYAQYGGAPIANVVGTRHVELATNDALVAEQRQVFGSADPGADRAIVAAGGRVATEDLLAAKGVDANWTETVLSAAEDTAAGRDPLPTLGSSHDPPADTSVTVGVNRSADRAFARTVGMGESDNDLQTAIAHAHTVQARVQTDVRSRIVRHDRAGPPGPDWTVVDETQSRHVTLERIQASPPRTDGWETRDGESFSATEIETTSRRWRRDGETVTTRTIVERNHRIDVGAQARTRPVAGAPQGDLDGALAETTERGVQAAIRDAGGYERIARETVAGDAPTILVNETADSTLDRAAIEADLDALRLRTRNRTVTAPARQVATGRANPPQQLLSNISNDHDELRGRADQTVEQRARIAAREAYLTELEAILQTHSSDHETVNDGMADAIGDHIDDRQLDGALDVPRNPLHPPNRSWTDPAGNLSLAVDTGPSYLPTSAVSRERIGGRDHDEVHPLATRNVNVFTSPHGHVVKSIFDRLPFIGDGNIPLATAARVLASMDGSEEQYDDLESEVAAANAHVRESLVDAMVAGGVPRSRAEAAYRTNHSTAQAGLELANGTATDRAIRRTSDTDVDRDRLRVRLALARERALADGTARPSLSTVSESADRVRADFRGRIEDTAVEQLKETDLGKRMSKLPAGIPIVPGYWYATGNAWYVEVGGTYERFAVRANRGDARAPTTYIREGRVSNVSHDDRELRLGRDDRVSFRTETVVVVVVPPGPTGVGDTDGIQDERSPGWPPGDYSPNGT